jgi:hypothetical protein
MTARRRSRPSAERRVRDELRAAADIHHRLTLSSCRAIRDVGVKAEAADTHEIGVWDWSFPRDRPFASGGTLAETRKIAAILAADVVGFSRMASADEDRTLARLRALRARRARTSLDRRAKCRYAMLWRAGV